MKDRPLQPGFGPPRDGDEEEIARLLRTLGPLDRVPEHELPPIKAKARLAWTRQVRRTAMRRRAVYAGGAIAAGVVIAVALVVLRSFSPPPSVAIAATLESVVGDATVGERVAVDALREVASGTTITTGDAGRTALRLAAGHRVRVDVGSSVRIVSGGSLRLERGAVYIDTEAAKDGSGASIQIETPLGRVTDLGTRFEVRLIPAEQSEVGGGTAEAGPDGVRVAVREGRVRLATAFGDHEAAAGSALSFYSGGRLDRATDLPYGSGWRWIESVRPPVEVEGLKLVAFLDWAAHESGRRWRFTDPDLRAEVLDVVLHGSIEGMTVEEALSTMLPSCGLRHRVAEGDLLVEVDES